MTQKSYNESMLPGFTAQASIYGTYTTSHFSGNHHSSLSALVTPAQDACERCAECMTACMNECLDPVGFPTDPWIAACRRQCERGCRRSCRRCSEE